MTAVAAVKCILMPAIGQHSNGSCFRVLAVDKTSAGSAGNGAKSDGRKEEANAQVTVQVSLL